MWGLDVCTDCDLGVADDSPVPGRGVGSGA